MRRFPEHMTRIWLRHYPNKRPQVTQSNQMKAMHLHKPAVELPRYRRGHFGKCSSDPSKFYR